MWEGFCAVEVPVSPKSQLQTAGEFVEVSVKSTDDPAQPAGGAEKLAAGGESNEKVCEAVVPAPQPFPAVRVTV